jgi:hypothetical protein
MPRQQPPPVSRLHQTSSGRCRRAWQTAFARHVYDSLKSVTSPRHEERNYAAARARTAEFLLGLVGSTVKRSTSSSSRRRRPSLAE